MSETPPSSSSLAGRIAAGLVMVMLLGVTVLLVPRHEPWFDEAQAWLLARDAPLWDLLWKYARYEGSPSLWHLLLMLPAKAGAPPLTLNIISSDLALCSAGLLLFRSPFPWVLRLLLPAGFFFFYQYGIVARSYALMMPLMWLVGMMYAGRFERPWRYVSMLILLSNVSLHGSVMAGVLMTFFVGEAWWREKWTMVRLAPLVLAFAADTAFIVAQLWRPADLVSANWGANEGVWKVIDGMWLDCVLPWHWAAALVLLVAGGFFYVRGVLLSYLATTGAVMVVYMIGFYTVWHQGILFALLVLHAWMAWVSPVRRRFWWVPEVYWPRLATGVLTVTAVVHVWWTWVAVWNDWKYPYSGSLAAAKYLRSNGIDQERIHLYGHTAAGLLLYLDRNPFANVAPYMPGAFWRWTRDVYSGQFPEKVLEGNPPWILIGAQRTPTEVAKIGVWPPFVPGYAFKKSFPGLMFWKGGYSMTDYFYLYRREGAAGGS